MKREMFQNIVLELSDGRLIAATTPMFFQEGDPPITVKEVRVAQPQKLPEGCYWEKSKDSELPVIKQ